jgi:hypothetical protein
MNLDDILYEIRALSLTELTARLRISITLQRRPTNEFFDALPEKDRCLAIKMCLLAWGISQARGLSTQICPRSRQIEAVLVSLNKLNSIINVGTGQGKTLCGILPHHLFPDSVSVIGSPLKRLMVSQAKEYEDWGIHAVAITEDTSRQKGFWDVRPSPSIYGIAY